MVHQTSKLRFKLSKDIRVIISSGTRLCPKDHSKDFQIFSMDHYIISVVLVSDQEYMSSLNWTKQKVIAILYLKAVLLPLLQINLLFSNMK